MTASSLPETDPVAARRPQYQADIAAGLDRFFEPRRDDCPWCGGTRLTTRLRTVDLLQHKPGRFELSQCADCRHIFQNPRLSLAGLEFYYRDCYDGLGEKQMADMFEGNSANLKDRASLLTKHHAAKRWLDVGTGHGHFCRAAAEALPDTEFHGLDMSAGVELAAEHGWITRGFRGNFPEMTAELAGNYDVLSMFHYLEHTLDPKAELAAAAEVLAPGGYLVIELPDPECKWGRVLGKYWMPWLQPQHLNLMPIANLRAAAEEVGFTVVDEQRGEPHSAMDMAAAAMLWSNRFIGGDDVPWQPKPPSGLRKLLRKASMVLTVPMMVLAFIGDQLIAPWGRKHGWSNAYRVLLTRN
ncbi:class I SAM-dependent methyltransferase [Kutzneria sp. CA-103260]|uniref:class I SAM-dependent methyltransferase n=1 Tax=Kutzneria sp. CA-103260 TaxID=2802641 RepID=UPI001BADC451|nr:class I SAM-dependent methyltransferase [Kutzneria sp. CA-103260]QUQ62852.1 class I SAM-dependent methyltransferase [Kutzneria sp. CA-103260]